MVPAQTSNHATSVQSLPLIFDLVIFSSARAYPKITQVLHSRGGLPTSLLPIHRPFILSVKKKIKKKMQHKPPKHLLSKPLWCTALENILFFWSHKNDSSILQRNVPQLYYKHYNLLTINLNIYLSSCQTHTHKFP